MNEQVTGLRSDFYWFAKDRWEQVGLAEHRAGREEAARQDLTMAALMLQRLDELQVWADDGWRPVHRALLDADWPAVERDLKINGSRDVAP